VSRIRAVFLGTPEFARFCLEGLIKDTHFEVVGVVTQPDRPAGRKLAAQPSPVKELVLPLGIPLFTPESVNTPEAINHIANWRAEVAIVVAFGQILRDEFLALFPRKIVNVHGSLLPRWRGAAPIQRAIMAGDPETGVSLQIVVRALDAGDVLGYRKIPLTEDVDAVQAYESLKILAVDLLKVDLMDYLRGNLSPIPQDPALVTHAAKIDKAEARIDWKKSAPTVVNLIRGLAMGPHAFTKRGEASLKIHKAQLCSKDHGQPGQVVHVDGSSFRVACGEGAVEVMEVQPESRARMKTIEYLKGYPLKVGDVLE
jgi:methionyl-tRNA formyltransferase